MRIGRKNVRLLRSTRVKEGRVAAFVSVLGFVIQDEDGIKNDLSVGAISTVQLPQIERKRRDRPYAANLKMKKVRHPHLYELGRPTCRLDLSQGERCPGELTYV